MLSKRLSALPIAFVLGLFLLACSTSSTPAGTTTPTEAPAEAVSALPRSAPAGPAAPAATPEPQTETPIVHTAADLADLQKTLTALAEAYGSPGEFGFAVTDIQTGETVGVNINRRHLTGCAVNYFVLLQSTIDAQNGRIEESAVGDLIGSTIRTSNPVAARELYRLAGNGDVLAGLERVSTLIDDVAGPGTIFDHPPLYGHESLGVDPNNYITPAAMNEALRATYADGILEDEWRDYLLEKMTGVKDGLNYLLAVGPDVPVSHKNGFFPTSGGKWVDNDIGIVRFQQDGKERAYAVSFFSQWVPVKYGDVALGQQLSTATWEFFQERYPPTDLVTVSDSSTVDASGTGGDS